MDYLTRREIMKYGLLAGAVLFRPSVVFPAETGSLQSFRQSYPLTISVLKNAYNNEMDAHNSYIDLVLNHGMLGVLAGALALITVAKRGRDLIRSPSKNVWRGFGLGVVLAIAATAVIGLFERAPIGIPAEGTAASCYSVSPLPWTLAAILVSAHHIVMGQTPLNPTTP